MTGSNTLTSHHGESVMSPAGKMSGWWKEYRRLREDARSNRCSKGIKKKSNRKRRMFLKNPYNWDKI
jgi:hypothetical protein